MVEAQVILNDRLTQRRLNVDFVYKVERNSHRSRFYVIRKFLRRKRLEKFRIEDSNLGIVSNLLSYPDAKVSRDRFNREQLEAQERCGRVPSV